MIEKIKRQQQLLLWSVIIVLLVALAIMSQLWFSTKKVTRKETLHGKKHLTTGASRINPQEVWVHDFTIKSELTQKRLDALEKTLEQLLKINTSPKIVGARLPELPADRPQADQLMQTTSIGNLKQDLANIFINQKTEDLPPPPAGNREMGQQLMQNSKNFRSHGLKKISLNLNRSLNRQKLLKTTDNNIPAGSFAQAVLLGGVDASTSIQAASDPRPVFLRLIDPGTLPRRFKSDLEGCHVLGASYGDLSSERVYVRLEKLSCVERKTGETIEINVQGYVAGEDGRTGVRGSIVDKAGPNMRNAMIGGFFSSIGKFLGQARTPILFSPTTGLPQNAPLSSEEIFKQSAANGLGGALDKYADFYIKRAEQMQPVIQVAAGRVMDVVFTQGVDFGDSALRQVLSKTNDQKRYQQVQNLEETKPMEAMLPHSQGDSEL